MGSFEDDDYWESKFMEAWCHYHKEIMMYDEDEEAFVCVQCSYEFGA